MWPHAIIILALGILTQVSALPAAGPWQIVAFWYAYRINIEAFGLDKNPIAPGCRGSLLDGSCTLAEFAEYTRWKTKNGIPFPTGLLGADLTPNPLGAVQAIQNSGYKTGQIMDIYTVLPGDYPNRDMGRMPNLADPIKLLNEYVYKARVYMGNTLGFTQESFDSLPEFQNLKIAVRGVSEARRADFNSRNLSTLMDKLRGDQITPVLKTVIAVDSTTFDELDTALTISGADPNIDAETIVNKIVAVVMGAQSLDPGTVKHFNVIAQLDKWTSDLSLAVKC
ncbi:c0cce018-0dd8-4ded-b88e-b56bc0468414-CDS [Sclerotinia trifoliorum]|uniref:C0cce018-0dd8-4ded-b88e-b56bc0468414-CDS n=1 Tax=Sclerotinia trifoliorum TaxID=28548 RepID=A0A8H2ZUG2_9HELO|nr:c0cce018-0dd8-4ded-b88e-b56bc0468414-CDS [Sclerotinia trifoliorum]